MTSLTQFLFEFRLIGSLQDPACGASRLMEGSDGKVKPIVAQAMSFVMAPVHNFHKKYSFFCFSGFFYAEALCHTMSNQLFS